MLPHVSQPWAVGVLSVFVAVVMSAPAVALDTFRSIDNRLPNPDRPYDMTGDTVHFPSSPHFALYDLVFQPRTPSQLDIPTLNKDGNLEFDSSFDIAYTAVVSFSLEPAHTVSGYGTAHAIGIAPAGTNPQVFDTELVALNLYGLSPLPEVMFRESPSLRSSGVTTRENLCPPCASPVTYWRISSFFDVFAEVSFNSGGTWTPGDRAIHIEQVTDPVRDSDFNGDGVVDSSDYVAWRQRNGTMYTTSDYDLWRAHFGATTTTGSAITTPGPVPEPSTCLMLAVAAFGTVLSLRARQVNRHESWRIY